MSREKQEFIEATTKMIEQQVVLAAIVGAAVLVRRNPWVFSSSDMALGVVAVLAIVALIYAWMVAVTYANNVAKLCPEGTRQTVAIIGIYIVCFLFAVQNIIWAGRIANGPSAYAHAAQVQHS